MHAALGRLIGGAVSAVVVLAAFAGLLSLAGRALRGTSRVPRPPGLADPAAGPAPPGS